MNIFATDLDGTLLKKGSIIDESIIDAINFLKENNYNIIAVSGRVCSSIRYFTDMLEINNYIIGNNGAVILDKDDNVIYKNPIEKKILKQIFNIVKKYELKVRIYDKDTYYCEELHKEHINHMKIGKDEYSVNIKVVNNLEEYILSNNVDVFKLFLDTSQENYFEFYTELKKINDLELTYSGITNLDCMKKGTNKYTALKYLIDHIKTNDNNLIAIGDYYNDIEMVKHADIGIAMGNACKELKDVATIITDDVQDDGFSKAIYKSVNMIKMIENKKEEIC